MHRLGTRLLHFIVTIYSLVPRPHLKIVKRVWSHSVIRSLQYVCVHVYMYF